jgi:Methylamine utilisation protein MauE
VNDVTGTFRLILVITFALSATMKLRSLAVFREQLAGYRILPYSLVGVVAPIVVLLESLIVFGMVVRPLTLISAAIATILLSCFLGAMSWVVRNGRSIPCACFGEAGELNTVGIYAITRTACLLAVAIVVLFTSGGTSLDAEGGWSPLPWVSLTLLCSAILLVIPSLAQLLVDLRESKRIMSASLDGGR